MLTYLSFLCHFIILLCQLAFSTAEFITRMICTIVKQISYLRQYGELVEKHHRRTVLNHLPKKAYKKLDEPEMIDSPNLEEFVFCRVLEPIQIDVSEDNDNGDGEDLVDRIQEHGAGAYLIVMYKSIRVLVLEGKVELLM